MNPLDLRAILAANPFVAAPLDGYSDPAWRAACRRFGAGLCFTEMVPAIALVWNARDAWRRVRMPEGDTPTVVQIAGADPELMARAAATCQGAGARAIDVNAGCPSRRVTNGGAGSALLSDLPLLGRILVQVRQAVTVPVTLKVRSGPNASTLVLEEVARLAADTGMAALTLHPRTRTQMFRGKSDWSHIARMRELVSIPLIGNGDVLTGEDGLRMLRETGCDGVMVGRGAVGNPWVFRDLLARWRGEPTPARPPMAEWREVVLEQFEGMVRDFDGDDVLAAKLFRKHLARYARGMRGAVALRRNLPGLQSREALVAALDQIVGDEPGGHAPSPHEAADGDDAMEGCE